MAFLGLALTSAPAPAFLVSVHREITANALIGFSSLTEQQKRRIVQGSVDADLAEGALPVIGGPYDRRFHFDNSFSYQAVMENFLAVARLVDGNLAARDSDPWEFGKLLHAIEDFYSHSNYIPLFRDYVAQTGREMVGTVPPLEQVLMRPKEYKRFLEMLKRDLRTGRYPAQWRVIALDTDHGQPTSGGGMHKDWLGRTYYVDAREAATRAVVWYLRLYTKDPEARKEWVSIKAAFAVGAR